MVESKGASRKSWGRKGKERNRIKCEKIFVKEIRDKQIAHKDVAKYK